MHGKREPKNYPYPGKLVSQPNFSLALSDSVHLDLESGMSPCNSLKCKTFVPHDVNPNALAFEDMNLGDSLKVL